MKQILQNTSNQDYTNLINVLSTNIKEKRTIIFIGSGFTSGAKTTFGKKLLSGKELQELFIEKICTKRKDFKKEHFINKTFSAISEIFFQNFDNDYIKSFLKEHFTDVRIEKQKINFLNLNWRNIFTLNVDDAIENNSNHRKVIYPYQKIPKDIKDYSPLIYKLHGDIISNILKGEIDLSKNIIFTESSYLTSILGENIDMLNEFLANYRDFHCLFIGCSLQEEDDLKAIIAKNKHDLTTSLDINRIYVTSQKLTPVDLETYKNQFSINTVLQVDDYDKFYSDIINNVNNIKIEKKDYIFDQFKIQFNNNNNERFLVGEHIYKKNNVIELPKFIIERDIKNNLINKIEKDTIFLIVGKRLSGKTYFLIDIYNSIKTKKVLLIPSYTNLDFNKFTDLLSELNNAIIIFDSNSFDEQQLKYVASNQEDLNNKNIKIIFTFNQSEKMELAYFYAIFENNYHEIEIENKFSQNEIKAINLKLDKLSISRFKNKTIIKNLFDYEKIYGATKLEQSINNTINNMINNKFEYSYIGSILLLLTFEKVYSSTFYNIYGSSKLFNQFYDFASTFIEKEETSLYEINKYSGFKLILTCDSCLISFLNQIIKNKKISFKEIAQIILHISKKLYNTNQKYIVKQLVMFSNLNSIFGQYENVGGARSIIFQTYKILEDVLYEDTDYWLQRAISHLYLSSKASIDDIDNGIKYAKKAYEDFMYPKKKNQALHTLSMLYGRKASSENYKHIKTIEVALDYYIEAIKINNWNKKYIIKIMTRKKHENDIFKLINNVNSTKLDKHYKDKYDILCQKYFDYNRR